MFCNCFALHERYPIDGNIYSHVDLLRKSVLVKVYQSKSPGPLGYLPVVIMNSSTRYSRSSYGGGLESPRMYRASSHLSTKSSSLLSSGVMSSNISGDRYDYRTDPALSSILSSSVGSKPSAENSYSDTTSIKNLLPPSIVTSSYTSYEPQSGITSSLKKSSLLSTSNDISSDASGISSLTYGSVGVPGTARQSRHRSLNDYKSTGRNRSISPLSTSRQKLCGVTNTSGIPGLVTSSSILPSTTAATHHALLLGSRPASSASMLNRSSNLSNLELDTFGLTTSKQEEDIFNNIKQRILQRSAADRVANVAGLSVGDTLGLNSINSGLSTINSLNTSLFPEREIKSTDFSIQPASIFAATTESETAKQIRAIKRSIGTDTSSERTRTKSRERRHEREQSSSHRYRSSSRSPQRHHSGGGPYSRGRPETPDSADYHHHCCSHHHHGRQLVRSSSSHNLRGDIEDEIPHVTAKKGRARHQTLAYGVSASDLGVAATISRVDPSTWSEESAKMARAPVLQNVVEDFRKNLRGFNSDMSVVAIIDNSAKMVAQQQQQQKVGD